MAGKGLVRVNDVPLAEVGMNWPASTGTVTFTAEDFVSAVQAFNDPAVRSAIVKIGHTDPRFNVPGNQVKDGQPALGRIVNVRTTNNGQTLVGDFEGVPEWLADVLPYAYPQRSIEARRGVATKTGNTWSFVLTGVALLGEMDQAVETLDDIKAIFAGSVRTMDLVTAAKGGNVPTPIHASVEVETVVRAYYDQQDNVQTFWWVRSVQLSPNNLIVDDDQGHLYTVPFTISSDKITFGDQVEVTVEYVPKDEKVAASAPVNLASIHTFATRELSRANMPPVHAKEIATMAEIDPNMLRKALRLPETATDEDVAVALAAQAAQAEPPPNVAPVVPDPNAPAVPPNVAPVTPAVAPVVEPDNTEPGNLVVPAGTVLIDASALRDLQAGAADGRAARELQRVQDRDRFIGDAVKAGKFAPALRAQYGALMDANPAQTRALIEAMAANVVPVAEVGQGEAVSASGEPADAYPASWLSPKERANVAAARGN